MHTYLPTYPPTYLPTHLPVLRTCLHTYLPHIGTHQYWPSQEIRSLQRLCERANIISVLAPPPVVPTLLP